MIRKQLSKKRRFEVFKRDFFTCQYCGATPPHVVLHVDHINPVKLGGGNDLNNLVTSCDSCNLGKAATPLSSIPKSIKDTADDVAEREEQIKGYYEVIRKRVERIEAESWKIAAALDGQVKVEEYDRSDLLSIQKFLEKLPYWEVYEASKMALAKMPHSRFRRFKYFCGVCWKKIRESEVRDG